MKSFTLILFILVSSSTFAQYNQVQFKEGTFENGMLYPIVVTSSTPEVALHINEHLQTQIADLKSADFCIGQYGFVQKIDLIQIHIFCNCVDFDESQNRYYLYDVNTGKAVNNMKIIGEKKVKKFSSYFEEKVKYFAKINSLELNKEQLDLITSEQLDAFTVIFSKDGINLLLNDGSWEKKSLYISWVELKPFMEFH